MTRRRQPTAVAFTRKQESFANLILKKVRDSIALQEAEEGDQEPSETLLDLYDEEMFWARYARVMREQRDHLHEVYDI